MQSTWVHDISSWQFTHMSIWWEIQDSISGSTMLSSQLVTAKSGTRKKLYVQTAKLLKRNITVYKTKSHTVCLALEIYIDRSAKANIDINRSLPSTAHLSAKRWTMITNLSQSIALPASSLNADIA